MKKALIGTLFVSAIAMPALVAPALAQIPVSPEPPRFVAVPVESALSSKLTGLAVTNEAGNTIGEIKDVVLGPNKTVVGYVVSVGGFLGIGEHYVVVDPSALVVSYHSGDKKWSAVMDATAEQLKAAPAFKYDGRWK